MRGLPVSGSGGKSVIRAAWRLDSDDAVCDAIDVNCCSSFNDRRSVSDTTSD